MSNTEKETTLNESQNLPRLEPGITAIPEYNNEKFTEIIRNSGLISKNSDGVYEIFHYLHTTFDRISIWWRSQENISEQLCKLKHFKESSQIPQLECEEISGYYENIFELADNANIKINEMYEVYSDDYKKPLLKKFFSAIEEDIELVSVTGEIIKEYLGTEKIRTIVFSVCEAIEETQGDIEPKIMRQKIAQQAWEELKRLIPYAIAHNRRIPIIDENDIEKEEIKKALKSNLWNNQEVQKHEEIYKELLEQVVSSKDKSLITNFKALYKATQDDSKEISAFNILLLQDRVWKELYNEKAFTR